MKARRAVLTLLLAGGSAAFGAHEILDDVSDALSVASADGQVSARLSGLLDVELYFFDHPPPGLIEASGHSLFNPRLTLFLDSQLGPRVYLFAQARVDRGFDPRDGGAQVRLDEYAVRFTPWEDGRLNVQAGKFATVVGNWAARHYSWENPFITAPLPYENLTAIWDSAAVRHPRTLFSWAHVRDGAGGYYGSELADKHLRNPIVWGPAYGSGLSVFGRLGKAEYAAEVKNSTLSSRPGAWDATRVQWQHPTFSGRVGFRPDTMWNLGFSASTGSYLLPGATASLAPGHGLGDYRQTVLGQDVSFAWHHFQLWAEFYEARFEIPTVGNADTFAYYVEAKYKFAPQLFGALRWNQQFYSTLGNDPGRWGRDTWRADVALACRFTAHSQLKLQYSLGYENLAPRDIGQATALQLTLRF